MNLLPHVVLGTAAGAAVWAGTRDASAVPIAVAAAVLPDLDHIPDMYLRYVRRNRDYLFLPLHAWEYFLAGGLVYAFWVREPRLLAVLAGYLTQIGADQISNKVRWYTYFITKRAAVGFKAKRLLDRPEGPWHMAVVNAVPIGKERLQKWFEARLPLDQSKGDDLRPLDSGVTSR
jgi:hypothetical protein